MTRTTRRRRSTTTTTGGGGVIQASFIAMNERWTPGTTARRGVELEPEREDT